MSYIVSAVEAIARHLHPGMLVVLESTTYPGHDRGSRAADARGDRAARPASTSSSRSRPSASTRATRRSRPTTCRRWSAASRRRARSSPRALYGTAIETIVPVSSTRVAEMVKLLENTFRAVNIGLVNELALMCDRMNIDVWEVVEAAQHEAVRLHGVLPGPRPRRPLHPDRSRSTCRGRRSRAGSIRGSSSWPATSTARCRTTWSRRSPRRSTRRRKAINGSNVLIAGVAYKRDIDDMRESPALDVMGLLHAQGRARVVRRSVRAGSRTAAKLVRPATTSGASTCNRGDVRPVRLRRHRDRSQGLRLRGDGRAGRHRRRHAKRDQVLRAERLQTRRAASGDSERRLTQAG